MTLLQALREMERNGASVSEMARRMQISERVVLELLRAEAA